MHKIGLGLVCSAYACSGARIALGASSKPPMAADPIASSHSFAEVNVSAKGTFHPFEMLGVRQHFVGNPILPGLRKQVLDRRDPFVDGIGYRVPATSNTEQLTPSGQRLLPARSFHQATGWLTQQSDRKSVPIVMSSSAADLHNSDSNDPKRKISVSGDARLDARGSNAADLPTGGPNVAMPGDTLLEEKNYSTVQDSRRRALLLVALSAVATSPSILKSAVTQAVWSAHLARDGLSPCVLGRDVELRPNRFGRGLYALRDLEVGELIGRYTGALLSNDEFQRLYLSGGTSGRYAMELLTDEVIDGEDERHSSFVRFINHSVRKANCQSVDWGVPAQDVDVPGVPVLAAVYVETTRPVAKGEELFMDYGPRYWDWQVPRFSPKRLIIDNL